MTVEIVEDRDGAKLAVGTRVLNHENEWATVVSSRDPPHDEHAWAGSTEFISVLEDSGKYDGYLYKYHVRAAYPPRIYVKTWLDSQILSS